MNDISYVHHMARVGTTTKWSILSFSHANLKSRQKDRIFIILFTYIHLSFYLSSHLSFIYISFIFSLYDMWISSCPQDYIVHPTLEQWKLSHKLKLNCYCIKCERLSSCALCCTAHLWENMYQQNISKIVTKFWQVTGFWHRNI